MKQECMFLVVRLNGEVVDFTEIDDMYCNCQIHLDKEYLTDEDIEKFYQGYGDLSKKQGLQHIQEHGYLYEEGEAKDLTCDLSQYSIHIEQKEIEIN